VKDIEKRKEQLVQEVVELRQQLSEIKKQQDQHRPLEKAPQEYSQELNKGLMENAPIAISITTEDGEILEVNKAFLEMRGYTSIEDFYGTPLSARYANLRDRDHWLSLLREKRAVSDIEIQLLKKDGTPIWVSFSSMPLTIEGSSQQYLTVMQDITGRKQAEEKVRQSAEEWRTTFNSITDFMSIHDENHRIVRVNNALCDAVKLRPDEIIGKHCYEIFHGTNAPPPNCPHVVTLEDKKPATLEIFEPYLGLHLEVITSPLFDDEGKVVASAHLVRDITERKKMQAQLMISDRLASIGELVSGVAHELNNPMTGIIGFSELLLGKDISDDVRKDLEIINTEAIRTSDIVQGLLTFSRKQQTEKQSVDIHNVVKAVLNLRAYEQKLNNIEVNTHFPADIPKIIANGSQLQQVFLNLVVNAEQAMLEAHNQGILTITSEKMGNIVRISFTDDGPGISQEYLEHLFDPFFTTKEEGKGTGLGLSISYGIIADHGGLINAENNDSGGATFTVQLPINSKK